MPATDVVIVGAVRTAVARGYANGALNPVHPVDLLSRTLEALMQRTGVAKKDVEDVICGCVSPVGEQGGNIARVGALKAGFPDHVPGVQLNRFCGSGQQAVHFASQAIGSGQQDIVIACGVEMMSRVPMGSDTIFATGDKDKIEEYRNLFTFRLLHQGQSDEMISEKWNLTRQEMDKFSGLSHERSAAAAAKGIFKREIIPITVKKPDGTQVVFDKDEGVRVPVDYKKMATLKTPFKENGRVSPANASQLSDGAGALLLMSAEKAQKLGVKARARIVATAVVGSDPEFMLTGPIPATRKVLEKANLTVDQIDVFEINEAFAPVVLAWQKELNVPLNKINPNGGAIAHGHPLGATGCILMTKLLHELERTGARYGLQTMCIGYGMATATIIENLSGRAAL